LLSKAIASELPKIILHLQLENSHAELVLGSLLTHLVSLLEPCCFLIGSQVCQLGSCPSFFHSLRDLMFVYFPATKVCLSYPKGVMTQWQRQDQE
jgi:hypothetical protein